MFVDHATIECIAGNGGKGCNSYYRSNALKHPRPTGGDGGDGGSVILIAKDNVHTLLDVQMKRMFKAHSGLHGGSNHMNGANGADMEVAVPPGTQIYDNDTGYLLADLKELNQSVNVARGGKGGRGNHKKGEATDGDPGEAKNVRLELKLIADVGFVGFPNAGKSTLLSRLSNAKSRIGAFPFTTKQPVLGVLSGLYDQTVVMADIPGLIEGAHDGKGMGFQFLRHIERTRLFVHLVDIASVDGRDPVEDFRVISDELIAYSPEFKDKPVIVVVNKIDIPEAREKIEVFRQQIQHDVIAISAVTGEGLDDLKDAVYQKVRKLRSEVSK